ncbi:symmetrical bis(5'-nucleosyl)-tetraphosphatase [Bowmanella yangjiangensis]|uniref:bis(5'-nucleosyl)-tetraphosphatase (symmetrical) n=1 Tax=Bowmanella yangjiangensis TaxID=2811230 RepID=A0ABS3CSK4_9ALTE|nr:symmetrical bis(5'-nucleosyl)-tetraphosphatase [Bowmanella yangjiangensis]MBN7819494.1 symmetrical bis(5'-nucleosyl)-tetraphosphatase [Bowmanella yangjiangensis]
MTTFVVGDIQACLTPLISLLEKAGFSSNTDRLWAVGDLIGRGPQALETMQFLYGMGDSFDTVLGNHDLHFLAVYAGIKRDKPSDGFQALLASPNIKQLVDWLRQRPLAVLLDEHTLLSHAGLYPGWQFADALYWANQVSNALCSDKWQELLRNMYGSEPKAWDECTSDEERLIFTINCLTRMRFVSNNGQLDLQTKSGVTSASANQYPWFTHPSLQLLPSQQVLFGHWAALEGHTGNKQCLALDTGYIWGGQLSLYALETEIFYRVDQQ